METTKVALVLLVELRVPFPANPLREPALAARDAIEGHHSWVKSVRIVNDIDEVDPRIVYNPRDDEV